MSTRSGARKTVYLVDGTSNLFRAFYAIRQMNNSRGLPTNAVYGFISMLRKLLKQFDPEHLVVAFDLPGPTFRHQIYSDYKANRSETPEELIVQIPYVKRACEVLRIPTVEYAGFEADDLLATLAHQARRAGFDVVVVASDKDLLQLVEAGVTIYNPVSEKQLDTDGVEEVFGVKPHQVPDVLALWGDSSDNIPGVPGIGEKGAKDLIRRFGNLDGALSGSAGVERKSYRVGLQEHAESARLSLELATVRRDAPIEFEPQQARLAPPDAAGARELFKELEFSSLLREFSDPVTMPAAACEVITDPDRLKATIVSLCSGGRVALHFERDHPEPMRANPIGLALAGDGGIACYVPIGHTGLSASRCVQIDEVLRAIDPLLRNERIDRSGHDVKGDLVLLRRLGATAPGFAFDTMIASYLLNPSRRSHAIEDVAAEIAGLELPGYASIQGSGARRIPLADVDIDTMARFAGSRLAAVMALRDRLSADLEKDGLTRLMFELELPLTSILAEAERRGVGIDVPFLKGLASAWQGELERLTVRIHHLAGRTFNINSPKQLAEILFDTLKLQPGRRTRKTRSRSTGAEVLEELAVDHEFPRLLLEYRSLQKLKSTYVDTLPALVNPASGRVHTSFNQAVAATGRLSSSDPNLQNIPIRSEAGKQIRRAFVPERGSVLLSADYSQIELRVLAHLCGDAALVDAFRKGEDIHQRTAAELFGVMPDLVSGEMRRRAKAVNFGIIYGMGPQRLARDQGIMMKEAIEFIKTYFERFPKVKMYIDATVAEVENSGCVRTLFGRVRYFPEILGADRNARQQAIRAAVNTTIQGTAADLIKMAMVVLDRRLTETRSRAALILQVHDELVLETPECEVETTAALLSRVMEQVHPLDVPLTVDLSVGSSWLDMRTIHITSL